MNKCQVQQCQYRTTMQYTLYVQRCYYWLLLLENINKSIELEKTTGTQCNYDATKQSTRIGGVANGAMSAAFRVAFNDTIYSAFGQGEMVDAEANARSGGSSPLPADYITNDGFIVSLTVDAEGILRPTGGGYGAYNIDPRTNSNIVYAAPIDGMNSVDAIWPVVGWGGRVGGKAFSSLNQTRKENWFRVDAWGSWKNKSNAPWQKGTHFHLDPFRNSNELMRWHLPQQSKQWYYNTRSILNRKSK